MHGSNKLAESLIALIGIWLIISPIPDFIANIITFSLSDFGESGNQILTTSIVHVFVKILCGLILLISRCKIVSFLGLRISPPSDYRNLLSASIFLLGIYFVLNGFVSLGQYYSTLNVENHSNSYLFWQGVFATFGGVIVAMVSVHLSCFWQLLNRS